MFCLALQVTLDRPSAAVLELQKTHLFATRGKGTTGFETFDVQQGVWGGGWAHNRLRLSPH